MELTQRGREQAEAIAHTFPTAPARIVLSPYRRARQTAEPLQRRFPKVAIVEAAVQEFTYQNPERFRGAERSTHASEIEAYWQRLDPTYRDEDRAESFADLALRVNAFLSRAREWQGVTAVFTHGNFMRAVVLAVLLGELPPTREAMGSLSSLRQGLVVENGSRLVLEYRNERWWTGQLGDIPSLTGIG